MKEAIAKLLNLRPDEFDFEVNQDQDLDTPEVIVWGPRIDQVVISIENLEV